jgi:hypothetical protein
MLGDALVAALRRLPLGQQPLWLSLSAGLDSRVILAAAERAEIPYVPFIYVSPRMSPADRLIPPQLARALGRELAVHRRRRRQRQRLARERGPIVSAHSAGHVSMGDAQPLLQGTRDALQGISAGGWGFGAGKALNRGVPPTLDDPAPAAQALGRMLGEPGGSPATAALREWLEWTIRTPQDTLDWRDRFYIEQRLAGWQSSKEQVYDLVALERFPVINAGRCYALMFEIDEPARAAQRHQRDLIERLCPALAKFPANPPTRELDLRRVLAVKARDDPLGLLRMAGRRTIASTQLNRAKLGGRG